MANNEFGKHIDYLCNLKLILVNGKMIKDLHSIDNNESKIEESKEKNLETKDFKETLNNICNLQLDTSSGKVKKIGTQK